MEQKNIAVLGGGRLGQAMKVLLEKKGVVITIWDADATRFPDQKPLPEIIPTADMVFFCVPSGAMREAIASVVPLTKPGCSFLSFAKGIDSVAGKTMPELFAELAPAHPLAVIGGPMLAEEISAGGNAAAVIASKDEMLRTMLCGLFSSAQFRAEPSGDLFSVALAGVLKNIYSVILGIADGIKVSGNEKGWLVSQAIEEMVGIGKALGTDEKIILGTAGVGDLVATGYSPYSRNRQAGDEIVATGTCAIPGEGLLSLPAFTKRLGAASATNFPLLGLLGKICVNHEPAKATLDAFFEGR